MALQGLDHVNIVCADLDRSRRFYVELLGLTDGPRPPVRSVGAWLYLGDRPVVHLVLDPSDRPRDTGRFDHVAFEADDFETVRERLNEHGVAFRETGIATAGIRQLFFPDPDGVNIELNFRPTPPAEGPAGGGS